MTDQESVTPTPASTPATAPASAPPRELPHTRFGIASFVLALCASFGLGAMVAFLGVIETIRPTLLDHNEFLDMLLGFAFLFGVGVEFVALALGIAGWVQRDRKRTFAVLGVVFSSATLSLLTLAVILSAE